MKLFNRLVMLGFSTITLSTAACGTMYTTHVDSDEAALGKVVVYRIGIAYYERKATVVDGHVMLTVPHDKVDDFLKSLTVADARTGKPLPIAYPTQGANQTGQVDMEIQVQDRNVRDVVITYITASPAWKPSYRFVVRPDHKVDIQGWAIVDNTSGETWKKVQVGVGSSSALSFRYDLRTVRNVFREQLKGEERIAVAPPTGGSTHGTVADKPAIVANFAANDLAAAAPADDSFAETVATAATRGSSGAGRPGRAPAARQVSPQRERIKNLADELNRGRGEVTLKTYAASGADEDSATDRGNWLRNELIAEGVAPARLKVELDDSKGRQDLEIVQEAVAATAADGTPAPETPVGESHFQSPSPITVERGTSALVAVLDKVAEGDIVYLYDPRGERGNTRFAFRSVRVVNPTPYTLETGPVTVYGEERFIGEGLTDPIPPHATAMVPFALDRQVIVEEDQNNGDRISKLVSLQRGVLRTEVKHEKRTTYKVTSLLREETRVFIKHDVKRGWTLVKNPTIHERMGESHLFEVTLAAQETKTVEIVESTPLVKTFDLRSSSALDVVALYLDTPDAEKRFREPMAKLIAIHQEMYGVREQIELSRLRISEYRTRMAELEGQLHSLKNVPNARTLMAHLQQKLKEMSNGVQKDTIQVVNYEQQLMMARVRFQDGLSELTLEKPANAPTTKVSQTNP